MSKTVQIGVATLIFGADNSVLLGKRKGSHGAGTWSLPGGRMEFGEDPTETALREVKEETGLELPRVFSFQSCPYNSVVIDGQHWVTLVFSSKPVHLMKETMVPRVMEPDKCEEWRWFHLVQLPEPLFAPFDKLAIAMGWKFKNDLAPVV